MLRLLYRQDKTGLAAAWRRHSKEYARKILPVRHTLKDIDAVIDGVEVSLN